MAEKTIVLDFEIDVDQSIESIKSLTEANKRLREERNKLNIASEEGRKKAQEINATIDQNTAKIKANVSAIEQQKINIGNYKSALEGVVPGLKNVTGGVEKVTVATNAFKLALGPIGIILALVTAAITLLSKYLLGTQEGMDKVTAVTRPLMAILDRLAGVLQVLGGKLFKALGEAIQNPIQALKDLGNIIKDNIIKRFEALALFGPALKKILSGDIGGGFKDLGNAAIQATTGVEDGIGKIQQAAASLSDFVDEAWEQGKRLNELQKAIERGEISQIVRTKELQLLIKQQKAIVEDETRAYEDRIKAAQRARQAQDQILREELRLLDLRIEKMKLQQSLNDTSREDEKELSELLAQRLELQAQTTEQAIEFDKKINEIQKKQTEEYLKGANARIAANAQEINQQTELQAGRIDAELSSADAIVRTRERLAKDIERINEKQAAEEIATKEKTAEMKQIIDQQNLAGAMAVTDGILALVNEQGEAYRAVATAQALISTYTGATKAYEAAFLPVPTVASPALGVVFAAAAVAQGLANIARINGIEFAEGGWTGPGRKWDVAGVVHADEYVVPKHIVNNPVGRQHVSALEQMRLAPYADGGMVTRSISNPINQNMEIANALKNLPPIYASWKEFNQVDRRMKAKQSISKI